MISVVITVLNEAKTLPDLLASLESQTRSPDEIVIADGGSSDGSLSVIDDWRSRLPLTIVHAPGANISEGRNAGISRARGEIILSTDAGVRLVPTWVAALAAPMEERPELPGVAGFFEPDPRTVFELAMGATVLPAIGEIDPHRFLPSSRSFAFRKAAWEQVGGYPEWLDYCEDLVFDFALADAFGSFGWAPDAIAYFRPRSTMAAFFRQYFQYARGDGKANLWLRRHLARYITYVAAAATILFSVVANPWLLLLLPIGGIAYCQAPARRLIRAKAPIGQRIQALILVPAIRLVGDLAKMIGYPVGLWWRLRRKPEERLSRKSTPPA